MKKSNRERHNTRYLIHRMSKLLYKLYGIDHYASELEAIEDFMVKYYVE